MVLLPYHQQLAGCLPGAREPEFQFLLPLTRCVPSSNDGCLLVAPPDLFLPHLTCFLRPGGSRLPCPLLLVEFGQWEPGRKWYLFSQHLLGGTPFILLLKATVSATYRQDSCHVQVLVASLPLLAQG